ncbi:PAS domain-containing protein [Kiloniella antarctica]|uniref:PAS domain-containing protein n=1 Tax=Kiloniella antarctica TaxID=1550907 RepID=A0ABW5BGM2_9PROT
MTKLKLLHSYWCAKKELNAFPSRKDIDPLDFSYVLGDVSLIDVIQNEEHKTPRFNVRLLGSNIQTRVGSALINKNIEEFPEQDSLNKMKIAYQNVLRTKEPVAYPSLFTIGEKKEAYICCIWPLSSDGDNIDMLLCCREKVAEEKLIPNRTERLNQHPTWPYQGWAQNQLLNQLEC